MILDDALSAVDAETEAKILSNLRQVRENKSTIIATHRISSIMYANDIIVLDHGKVVANGLHEYLIKEDGWYSQMYKQQQLQQKVQEGTVENG